MRHSAMMQLTLAKLRDLVREPEALFWVFVFPLLLALALGIAFRNQGPEVLPVGVQQGDEEGAARWWLRMHAAMRTALGVRPDDPLAQALST